MRAALLHDHATGRSVIARRTGRRSRCRAAAADFERRGGNVGEPRSRSAAVRSPRTIRTHYLEACRRALEHIAAGDVYQANLARRWRAPLPQGLGAADLYRRLRAANPGAFAGIAALPGFSILSSSPERLVRVRGRRHRYPADRRHSTAARGPSDAAAIAELTGSPKEQAEHVMLIDLERNDLGRLCEAGTVRVDEFMVVESYAHVHHIVSNVSGRLRADVEPGDVIRALFPGGTITGCPKVRCMQLIGDLEGIGRGAYTGAMGYLALDGSLDLNILIRTMTVQDGEIELRAGAGIVADSEPERELEETRAKARGPAARARQRRDDARPRQRPRRRRRSTRGSRPAVRRRTVRDDCRAWADARASSTGTSSASPTAPARLGFPAPDLDADCARTSPRRCERAALRRQAHPDARHGRARLPAAARAAADAHRGGFGLAAPGRAMRPDGGRAARLVPHAPRRATARSPASST